MSCLYDRVEAEARRDPQVQRDFYERPSDWPSATDLASENAADPSWLGRGVDGAHQQEG